MTFNFFHKFVFRRSSKNAEIVSQKQSKLGNEEKLSTNYRENLECLLYLNGPSYGESPRKTNIQSVSPI